MSASAKCDPFASRDALMLVGQDGRLFGDEFPGLSKFWVSFTHVGLKSILRQETWPLSWSLHQPQAASNLGLLAFHGSVEDFVCFWVTSTAKEVGTYLHGKSGLLQTFLSYNTVSSTNDWSMLEAIDEVIHSGAEIIALLSEHEYYGTGEPPWLRHRFKKQVMVTRYMIEILTLLFEAIPRQTFLDDNSVLDEFTQHAQRHNARTLCAWKQALVGVTRGSSEDETDVWDQEPLPADEGNGVNSKDRDGWETENSRESHDLEWETEEEYEEGFMLDTAVDKDHWDDANRQISRPRGSNGGYHADYDEEYWSHIYDLIEQSNLDQGVPNHSEGALRRIAKATRNFLSYIV
ncbi:hypothetical protein QQX98_008517 [Neonectria punicea]|uniref:Uncharacterized protein n=1 Tax=Neonectria punicea TaxID=979145 RepID=A0ABR1GUV1_9HYPO